MLTPYTSFLERIESWPRHSPSSGSFYKRPHATISFQTSSSRSRTYPFTLPKSLLGDLGKLRWRKGFGLHSQYVDTKANREALIPIAEHSAF